MTSTPSAIHPTAQAGWSGRGAEDYEAGRPGYPRAAVELIGAELQIGPGRVVLDLAAGTGKLTRLLGSLGAEVIAVEPVAAMRAQLTASAPGAHVLEGTRSRSRTVRCTQSSSPRRFIGSTCPRRPPRSSGCWIHRGGLAILRNVWDDEGAAWVAPLSVYIRDVWREPPAHARDELAELDATARFAAFTEGVVPNDQYSDLEGLVRRVASMSYIAALPDDERGRVLDGARRLLVAHGLTPGVTVAVPTRTVVRWAAVRPRP